MTTTLDLDRDASNAGWLRRRRRALDLDGDAGNSGWLRGRVSKYSPDQPRDDTGRWTDGGGGDRVSLSAVSDKRAWRGETVRVKRALSKRETGELGEAVALAYMRRAVGRDSRPVNAEQENFPVDLVGDRYVVEVKTGLVSNGPSAQQWRATLGQPGPAESEWLTSATTDEKRAWNERKQRAVMDRKLEALERIGRQTGRRMQPATVALIVDPDRRLVDVYRFEGFHQRVGWASDVAEAGYAGTFRYE